MSELIIKVEWYSPVEISYNGYRIMSHEDWNQLQELIKSDTQVPYTNTPKWWEESFPASDLSDSFSIFSGPGAEHPGFDAPMTEEEHQSTLESFKKLFPDGDVGDTSIIDSVFELNSDDGGDFEQMDEDGDRNQIAHLKRIAADLGRASQCWIHVYVVCRETEREARDYLRHYVVERGDDAAVANMIRIFGAQSATLSADVLDAFKFHFKAGFGGYPLVGTPEQIVEGVARLSALGGDGLLISWVD